MLSRRTYAARLLLARPAALPEQPHLWRDLGMDDWQGSIGISRAGLVWPLPRA